MTIAKNQKPKVRPAPVSLHPLSTEQAVGALLRTPQPGATTAPKSKGKDD
jgi:hypothetical protein